MNSTAATHDTSNASVTTWNSERVYSPVLESAVAIGRNPAAVTSVPVSIGNAVVSYANAAARMREKPCSISVSYTHLDVYKRQSAGSPPPARTAACRP